MMDTCRTSVPTSGNTDNAAAAPAADKTLVTTMSCGWWQSGDARKLFAPCKEFYGNGCHVKAIVIERFELLESIDGGPANWDGVVNSRYTTVRTVSQQFSKLDVFSLRDRSLFLALALKQFVLHVTT